MDFESLLRKGKIADTKPVAFSEIQPGMWTSEWADKPSVPMKVGVRLLSEQSIQESKAEASRVVVGFYEGATEDQEGLVDSYNDALMRSSVARGICAHSSAKIPFFALGEEEVRQHMTPEGVRFLFQEIEAAHIAHSPCQREVDRDECLKLAVILQREVALERLRGPEKARVGRMLSYCLDALEEAEEAAEADGEQIFNA